MGLFNILAMKCAYPQETTLCYTFRPSDDLRILWHLKAIKEKAASNMLQEGPP